MNDAVETIKESFEINDIELIHSPEWYQQLKTSVGYLILHDFPRLVQILYQMDVSENKLKNALELQSNIDAAEIITELMIDRQLQKLKSKQQFSSPNFDDSISEERW